MKKTFGKNSIKLESVSLQEVGFVIGLGHFCFKLARLENIIDDLIYNSLVDISNETNKLLINYMANYIL